MREMILYDILWGATGEIRNDTGLHASSMSLTSLTTTNRLNEQECLSALWWIQCRVRTLRKKLSSSAAFPKLLQDCEKMASEVQPPVSVWRFDANYTTGPTVLFTGTFVRVASYKNKEDQVKSNRIVFFRIALAPKCCLYCTCLFF